jgi:signal transduction histidine kinase
MQKKNSMPQLSSSKLLIVDDEAPQMQALCSTLQGQGYETVGFASAHEALTALRHTKFHLILTDLMMPEMDGIALLKAALHIDPELVGVIMTGQGTIDSAVQAMQTGALDYILKPFKLSAILPVLSRALAVRRLRLENAELQEKIRQRTLELETANKDLESFTYSVSHDLRAPLRHIIGFVQIFGENHSSELSSDAKELLTIISLNAQHMSQLIEDLLRFSRLGRQPLSMQPVKLAELVREVLEEMRDEQRERKIDIQIGDLPDCFGDTAMLKQVFVNLLSNAFKFTRQTKNPAIEINCKRDEENVYFVRDNGAGFNMKYAQKLFDVFHRLHSDDQFEGTGVGLSIVHRIIQRHGGNVWAEAEVNKGATFYFNLGSKHGRPSKSSTGAADS